MAFNYGFQYDEDSEEIAPAPLAPIPAPSPETTPQEIIPATQQPPESIAPSYPPGVLYEGGIQQGRILGLEDKIKSLEYELAIREEDYSKYIEEKELEFNHKLSEYVGTILGALDPRTATVISRKLGLPNPYDKHTLDVFARERRRR